MLSYLLLLGGLLSQLAFVFTDLILNLLLVKLCLQLTRLFILSSLFLQLVGDSLHVRRPLKTLIQRALSFGNLEFLLILLVVLGVQLVGKGLLLALIWHHSAHVQVLSIFEHALTPLLVMLLLDQFMLSFILFFNRNSFFIFFLNIDDILE